MLICQRNGPLSARTISTVPETLIPQTGWASLSSAFPDLSKSVSLELFDRYASDVALASRNPEIERKFAVILTRNMRDLFFAYSIMGAEKELAELLALCRLFSADPEETFGDINRMFAEGFNPYWKLSAYLFHHELYHKKSMRIKAKVTLNGLPDGEGNLLIGMLDFNPLQLYRTVYHLQRVIYELKPLVEIAKPGQPIDLPPTVYYAILLRHHSPLIKKISQMFNLFYQNSERSSINLEAETLHSRLTSSSPDSANEMAQRVTYIKKNVDHKYFPQLFFPELEKEPYLVSPIDLALPLTPSSHKKKKFYQQVLDDPRITMLASCHRKGIIEHQVTEAYSTRKGKPEKILKELHGILMSLFQESNSKEYFLESIPSLVHHIHILSHEIHQKNTLITDSWERMLYGDLSKEELSYVLNHLNIECTRLYRSTNVFDLCSDLEKFIPSVESATSSSARPQLRRTQTRSRIQHKEKLTPTSLESAAASHSFSTIQEKKENNIGLESVTKSNSCPSLKRCESSLDFRPNQLSLSEISLRIGDTIIYQILSANDEKAALKIAANALQFAVFAIDGPVANYHVARSIYFAFCEKSVARLKFLTSSLSGTARKHYDRLEALFEPKFNYANYRQALQACNRPYIPHLGLLKADFTFSVESDESDSQKELVQNLIGKFEKLSAMLKVAVPIVPCSSDSIEFLNTFDLAHALTRPNKKIDLGAITDWDEGEWEALPSDEKCWYVSYSKWPSTSTKMEA